MDTQPWLRGDGKDPGGFGTIIPAQHRSFFGAMVLGAGLGSCHGAQSQRVLGGGGSLHLMRDVILHVYYPIPKPGGVWGRRKKTEPLSPVLPRPTPHGVSPQGAC